MEKKLHLDSEYRKRFELFELDDGTVEDSRLKNWREVDWDRVVKITVSINDKVYIVDNIDKKDFKGFFNYRAFGKYAQFEGSKYIGHKTVQEWIVGWADSTTAHLISIDFYIGDMVSEFEVPVSTIKGHIHPKIAHYWSGINE